MALLHSEDSEDYALELGASRGISCAYTLSESGDRQSWKAHLDRSKAAKVSDSSSLGHPTKQAT